MPTLLSRCHGGIWRSATRALIERAHGLASSNVVSGIGAIESTRWHASHFSWKIGEMSLVKVGFAGTSAKAGVAIAAAIARTPRGFHVLIAELLLTSRPREAMSTPAHYGLNSSAQP